MDAATLRARQAPLKEQYRQEPASAATKIIGPDTMVLESRADTSA